MSYYKIIERQKKELATELQNLENDLSTLLFEIKKFPDKVLVKKVETAHEALKSTISCLTDIDSKENMMIVNDFLTPHTAFESMNLIIDYLNLQSNTYQEILNKYHSLLPNKKDLSLISNMYKETIEYFSNCVKTCLYCLGKRDTSKISDVPSRAK